MKKAVFEKGIGMQQGVRVFQLSFADDGYGSLPTAPAVICAGSEQHAKSLYTRLTGKIPDMSMGYWVIISRPLDS